MLFALDAVFPAMRPEAAELRVGPEAGQQIIRRQPCRAPFDAGSIRLPLPARRKCRPSDFEPKRLIVTRNNRIFEAEDAPDASI
jgi:hypothetical protein